MSLKAKMEFIIDNDGCELSDGYQGLQNFLRYCVPPEDTDDVLNVSKIASLIEDHYTILKEELEEEEAEKESIENKAEVIATLIMHGFYGKIKEEENSKDLYDLVKKTVFLFL